jgi:hypothetical protein
MSNEYGAAGGMRILKETRSNWIRTAPVAICSPKILIWNGQVLNTIAALKSRLMTRTEQLFELLLENNMFYILQHISANLTSMQFRSFFHGKR